MIIKVGMVPADIVQEKLRRRKMVVNTLIFGYLILKVNDILLLMVFGDEEDSKIFLKAILSFCNEIFAFNTNFSRKKLVLKRRLIPKASGLLKVGTGSDFL